MASVQIELNDETLKKAREAAKIRHATLEGLMQEFVETLSRTPKPPTSILGLFKDEAQLFDQVMQEVYENRQHRWLKRDVDE